MNMIDVAVQVSAIVTLIALIWLSVRAFGKHIGWGMAVLLFSPPGALAFGHRYWKDVRMPLAVYTGAFLTTLALTLYLFSAWGGWELLRTGARVHQGMQANKLAAQDASNFLKANLAFADNSGLDIRDMPAANYARRHLVREAMEAARLAAGAEAAEEAAEEADKVPYRDIRKKVKSIDTAGYRLEYIPIDVSEARDYIGYTMKVTRRNVLEKEYRLTGASRDRLQFSQRNRNGRFSFSFRTSDIEKLRVLVKQAK